ncbi:MAG: hypothetical protein M3461_03630 [Pseudomonadota bacterium]|nr:hypothetical protein [Pseudomonadota bacterium]
MDGYAAPLQESRIQEFHYRFARRSQAVHPGYHEGVQSGQGQDFRAYEPLFRHRDARRLDLRVTLRDPFGMPHVRVFNQRSTAPVYTVADLSGSMGSVGDKGKLQLLAEFTAAAVLSAYRSGDPFGFIGCDAAVRCDLLLPAAHRAGAAWDLADRLSKLQIRAADAAGLREASRYLSVRRSLVFLVSDFHLPFALIDDVLVSMSRHAVVPIVVWESAEYRQLPAVGLAQARDRETGATRTLLFRPQLHERFQAAFAERRRDLTRLFMARGCAPLFLIDRFEANKLTEYFLQ